MGLWTGGGSSRLARGEHAADAGGIGDHFSDETFNRQRGGESTARARVCYLLLNALSLRFRIVGEILGVFPFYMPEGRVKEKAEVGLIFDFKTLGLE